MTILDTDPAEQADVGHLLDLLELLPRQREVTEKAAVSGEFASALREIFGDDLMAEWDNAMATWSEDVHQAPHSWIPIQRLVDYLLDIVAYPNPALWKVFDQVRPREAGTDHLPPGTIGRLWAKDLAETSWRLYVRMEAADRRGVLVSY